MSSSLASSPAMRGAGLFLTLQHDGPPWAQGRDRENAVLGRLLLLAGSGDRRAFAAFYDRTASRVFTFVRSQLVLAHEAEPATLNVYLRIWRSAPRFAPDREGAMQWALMQACIELPGRLDHSVRWRQSSRTAMPSRSGAIAWSGPEQAGVERDGAVSELHGSLERQQPVRTSPREAAREDVPPLGLEPRLRRF